MSLRSLVPPIVLVLIGPKIVSALGMDSPGPIAECTEATFTWQGDRPPYTLTITTADSSDTVFSANDITGTTIQWLAAVAAGTELIATLSDTPLDGGRSRDGSVANSFVIQPGSDSCLGAASRSNPSPSPSPSSAAQQTTDSHTSASSPSTSGEQSKTSPQSPTASASTSTSTSTIQESTEQPRSESSPSPTSSNSAPSQSQPLPGSGTTAPGSTGSTGSTGSAAAGRSGPGGFSSSITTPQPPGTSSSTQPSGSPDPDPRAQGRRSGSDAVVGAVVGALLAGVVLAAGLFCLWRKRTRRRRKASGPRGTSTVRDAGHRSRRPEPYEHPYPYPYPTEDTTRARPTVAAPSTSPSQSPPEYDDTFRFPLSDTGPYQPPANPIEQEMPGKAHQEGLPAMVGGAEESEGTGNPVTVRRRRGMDDLAPSDAFDDTGSSELSGSTAPPPYSQIDFEF